MCLREHFFQPHIAQGYCKGVISRFSGLEVKFLGRLKKPVMTKRASLSASSVSGVNGKNDAKSPTPSSMTGTEPPTPSPTPYQPFPQRRESQGQRRSSSSRRAFSSLSPSRTQRYARETWVPHPQDRNRLTLASFRLGHPVVSICNKGTRLGRRTRWIRVKLDSSAADELFIHFHSLRFCRHHPCIRGFPTPRRISGSFHLPDPPHLPTIRARFTKSSQPTDTPQTRRHRSNLALKLNTSPLRINKRIPTSPPVGTFQIHLLHCRRLSLLPLHDIRLLPRTTRRRE